MLDSYAILVFVLGAWFLGTGLVAIAYGREIHALWLEPVLRYPVLIVESDDWGTGPLSQAEALRCLSTNLTRIHDRTGHPPVMTLALVLAAPDGAAIRASGEYRNRTLADPLFAPVRDAIHAGAEQEVFALQLHGMEHYWPAALMASQDERVQEWLTADQPQPTEDLPAHLQSRWTDASVLPSRPLSEATIQTAAREEIGLYQRLFGTPPAVAVPPTFVWNPTVEAAWAAHGVEYVVTPGRRHGCRDASGAPGCDSGQILNNAQGENVTYLVRDSYFEPMLNHTADTALAALRKKTDAGRPCLLETHRANFMGTEETTNRAVEELVRLLRTALTEYPQLRFMSTEMLGQALRGRDPEWVEQRLGRRISAFSRRLDGVPRLGRLTRLSGVAALLFLLAKFMGHRQDQGADRWP